MKENIYKNSLKPYLKHPKTSDHPMAPGPGVSDDWRSRERWHDLIRIRWMGGGNHPQSG
jgi:hypothetical protein